MNPESVLKEDYSYLCGMKKNKLIDGAEIISLEAGKAVSLPLYEAE